MSVDDSGTAEETQGGWVHITMKSGAKVSARVTRFALDVAAIRAALDKATPGPWAMGAYGPRQEHVAYTSPRAAEEGIEEHTVSAYVPFVKDEECQPNAELIVLLRNNAEVLLDAWTRPATHMAEMLAEAERRGAVKALRDMANQSYNYDDAPHYADHLDRRADAIEHGEVSP